MSKRCCLKISRTKDKIKQSRLQPTILRRKRKAESECEAESSEDAQLHDGQEVIQPKMVCLNVTQTNCSVAESGARPSCQCEDALRTPTETITSFRGLTCMSTPDTSVLRFSPLPAFSWADAKEVWELMVMKEKIYKRDHQLMLRHPALHSRMRSILLDWLMEVCEVYRLHRSTYYLAQDFIDRYLAIQSNVPKQQLQLLGIACLFVAAKIEEIYPPKLSDFSYVTDEACTEEEILEKELVILKVLNWDLTPMTVNNWLNVYLQVASKSEVMDSNGDNFIFPDYSGSIFIKVSQLVDLCMLDMKCLQFSYSVIASSALFHLTSRALALSVSGFEWTKISSCVHWMTPFATTIKENGFAELKCFHQIDTDEMHSIQTHSIDLQLLEKAQSCQPPNTGICSSPPTSPAVLTPPQSTEKFLRNYVEETP